MHDPIADHTPENPAGRSSELRQGQKEGRRRDRLPAVMDQVYDQVGKKARLTGHKKSPAGGGDREIASQHM